MRRKTVALIGESFVGTGKGLYPVEISKAINKLSKNYKVKLFMRDTAPYNSKHTIKIKTIKTKIRVLAGLGYYIPLFFELRRDKSIDIIHAYDEKTSAFASLIKKPLVTTVCDMWPVEFNNFPIKNLLSLSYILLDRCEKIVTISEDTTKKLIKLCPFLSKKVTTIHLGTDTTRFIPSSKKRKKHITIGILGSEDGKIVDVFKKILLEYKDGVKIILGGSSIPKEFGVLRSFPNVEFKGFIEESELPKYYQDIDILVHNVNAAGFELIAVEAMASGCAVVASDVDALPEVIKDGGLLAKNSANGFYSSIKKLLDNKDIREECQKKGRKRAKNLTWDKCAEKYMRIYDEVLINDNFH